MNYAAVDPIVRTVLYEGAILYPYRPSTKNIHRWSFGCLYPPAYIAGQSSGVDAAEMQVECLLRADPDASVEVAVRFLHVIERSIAKLLSGNIARQEEAPPHQLVNLLEVAKQQYRPWQEIQEREFNLGEHHVRDIVALPFTREFPLPARRWHEFILDSSGQPVGLLLRAQEALVAAITLSAVTIAPDLHRLTVRIANRTSIPGAVSRDAALLRTLISAHTLLASPGNSFVSLTDPSPDLADAAKACRNVGAWPVLVGPCASAEMMLASPIILYDHPEIAPESPGDFFDGTEIDEMLTLRILTLTDDEKNQMTSIDEHARLLLERTQTQAREQLSALHGTMRNRRPVPAAENRHV